MNIQCKGPQIYGRLWRTCIWFSWGVFPWQMEACCRDPAYKLRGILCVPSGYHRILVNCFLRDWPAGILEVIKDAVDQTCWWLSLPNWLTGDCHCSINPFRQLQRMSSGPVILLTITFELMVISQDFCREVEDAVPINISRSNIFRKKNAVTTRKSYEHF